MRRGVWRNGLKRPVMPLTRFQSRILRLLAAHRNPESYVAGSTPLNREWPRFSEDIDIFHDREERVALAAEEDTAALRTEGLDIVWRRREPAIYTAEIRSGDESTHLEWVVDSDFRFFPTLQDELFGYPGHLDDYTTHAGRRRGHWPTSTAISAAMLEHYKEKPPIP